MPEDVRLGEGEKLFDFLAECIHSFMESRQLKGCNLPLGKSFMYQFPYISLFNNVYDIFYT